MTSDGVLQFSGDVAPSVRAGAWYSAEGARSTVQRLCDAVLESWSDDQQNVQATVRPAAWATWSKAIEAAMPLASGAIGIKTVWEPSTTGSVVIFDARQIADCGLVFEGVISTSHLPQWTPTPVRWPEVLTAMEFATGKARPRYALRSRGEVARVANACKDYSGLTDAQLAQLLPGGVTRETFNRWRRGTADRPTPANLRRMALLEDVFERLHARTSEPRTWLFAPKDGVAPYDLLRRGRLADVESLVASLTETGVPVDAAGALHRTTEPLRHDQTPSDVALSDVGWDEDDEDDVVLAWPDDNEDED